MGYFPVRYDSRVVIYERKMFIRLATEYLKNKCRLYLHSNFFTAMLDGSLLTFICCKINEKEAMDGLF